MDETTGTGVGEAQDATVEVTETTDADPEAEAAASEDAAAETRAFEKAALEEKVRRLHEQLEATEARLAEYDE